MPELQLLNVTLGIVASLVTILGAVRYKGPDGSVEWLSDRLGADLYELSGGLEEALAREPPMKVMMALQDLTDDGEVYTPDMLVTAAGNTAYPSALIEEALLGEDTDRLQLLGSHLSDEELSDLLDDRELWPDPIENVAQLEDSREYAYAWILADDATEEDRESLLDEIEKTYIEMNQAQPEAMHFIVRGVDELKELDSETVERYVKPWLKEQRNEEND